MGGVITIRCLESCDIVAVQGHTSDSPASSSSSNVVTVSAPEELGLTGSAIQEKKMNNKSTAPAFVNFVCVCVCVCWFIFIPSFSFATSKLSTRHTYKCIIYMHIHMYILCCTLSLIHMPI